LPCNCLILMMQSCSMSFPYNIPCWTYKQLLGNETNNRLSLRFNEFLKLRSTIVCFCKQRARNFIDEPYSLIVTQIMYSEG
jgi:hypothetical protein